MTGEITIGSQSQSEATTVSGNVLDPWGDPVPDSEVRAFDRTSDAEAILDSDTADKNGEFELRIEPTSETAFLAMFDSWFGYQGAFDQESVVDLEQIELTSQLLFGPELATTDDGAPVSAVTAWQTITDNTDRVLSIEAVAASSDSPPWDLFTPDEFLREGFLSITAPSPEIYIGFDQQYLHYNEHSGDIGETPAQPIMDWHPIRTGVPSFVPILYPRLYDFVDKKAEFQEEVFIRLLGLPSGFGLVFSLLETLDWAINATDRFQSEASVGDPELSELDMNHHNTILQGWNVTSTAVTFGVPIRFESEESQSIRFQGVWEAGPALDGTAITFGTEVILDRQPVIGTNGSDEDESDTPDNILFNSNFGDYKLGQYPNGWTQAGNESQEIVDEAKGSGENSLRMSGDPGGCWEAISHHPIPFEESGSVRIGGTVKPTSEGAIGCHENNRGSLILRTESSSDWYPGDGVPLFRFSDNGVIRGVNDTNYGAYQTDKWYNYLCEYTRSDGESTHTLWIDGEERGSVTRDMEDFENSLSAISLTSGDFTIYWGDIEIVKVQAMV